MLIDARRLPPGHTIECTVCVVGGGPAGIVVAQELGEAGVSVALLESGGVKPEAGTRDLDVGEVVDPVRHAPAELYRQRGLGGTGNVWGGRCAPLDEIDFEPRPHVPYSGWSLAKAELDPYYARAHSYLGLGTYNYNAKSALPEETPPMVPGLRSDVISSEKLWRYSAPASLMRAWIKSLRRSSNVTIYLHATCLKLMTSPEGARIDFLKAASLPQNEITVRASQYVLATGGLETPRILLLSNDTHEMGLGNGSDLVGRFYMAHLHGNIGEVRITPGDQPIHLGFDRTPEGIYSRRMLTIDEDKQREYELLNLSAFLNQPFINDPGLTDGILSARFLKELWFPQISLKRRLRAATPANRRPPRHVLAHLGNIVRDAPRLLDFSGHWAFDRMRNERSFFAQRVTDHSSPLYLTIDGEQSPNPDSRVTLGDNTDAFGLRRLRVDWRTTDLDARSILASCNLIAQELGKSKIGTFQFDPRIIPSPYITRAMGGHHLGTTRMASSPTHGVVDENCQVYGVNNLHIAGGSVFPTSGQANPTLTIVALAIRLAEHIKDRCLSSSLAPITELASAR